MNQVDFRDSACRIHRVVSPCIAFDEVPQGEFSYGLTNWIRCGSQITIPFGERQATVFKAFPKEGADNQSRFFCFLGPVNGIGERLACSPLLMRIGRIELQKGVGGIFAIPVLEDPLPSSVAREDRIPLLGACFDIGNR
jgi:hypothetical protein